MNGFLSSSSCSERQRLEKFFEDWIYHKTAKGKSWNKVWVVIRGHFMFAFKSRQTQKPDQLIGYLLLNYQTVCKNRGDDKPGRFKFDVHTIDRDGRMMHNRFRCETRPERDLWRGYIIGLATGRIPEDVPLTPSQLHAIASAMERLQINSLSRPPPVSGSGSHEFLSVDSHHNGSGSMMLANGIHSVSTTSSASSSGGSGGRPSLSQPVRENKHKFHDDPDMNLNDHPTWFIEVCSREKAEQILDYGQNYGSVLMRESTTFRDSGSYTISMRNFPGSATRFSHFQVMRVARGYKIQFDYEHEPLSCLSDIMAYFVSVSGTQPLRTNDVDILLSATTKPGNKNAGGANVNGHRYGNGGTLSHVNGNFHNGSGVGGGIGNSGISRKDSAMDIVNDAFQFLDNKSCISVNSAGNARGFCDCDGADGDACHYSVTGDDENERDELVEEVVIENGMVSNGFSHHSTSRHHNGYSGNSNNSNVTPVNNGHGYDTTNRHHNMLKSNGADMPNGRMNNHCDEVIIGQAASATNGNSGQFFQSELTARINRRKESFESDDTAHCPSSYSSNGGGGLTNGIPLLSSTLQTRVPPPPPPLPTSAFVGCDGTDELYVNSDDVIAQTNGKNTHSTSHNTAYSRPQPPQAPRLPPRPSNFTFESCSAELIEKLQRRLSRIPDA